MYDVKLNDFILNMTYLIPLVYRTLIFNHTCVLNLNKNFQYKPIQFKTDPIHTAYKIYL